MPAASSELNAQATTLKERFPDAPFPYAEDEELIQDLNLRVKSGQTAAIVGPTGAGKTTQVNLIMRFYDIDSGRILLDGVDIPSPPRRDRHSQVGMVLQDAILFEGTTVGNIHYGRLDATDEEVIQATTATYVDRFVHPLSEGCQTRASQDGGSFSVGERQLITIARALLSQPAPLILVMENGRIAEQGDHKTPIKAQCAYFRLHQSQFESAE